MDDFGRIIYLDVEKTGSTFISKFLQENMACQRVRKVKHGRIGNNFKKGSFYFISVRNPLSQYLSLYRYGCGGKGAIYESLAKSEHTQLYQPRQGIVSAVAAICSFRRKCEAFRR